MIYQPSAFTNHSGGHREDVDGRVQPLYQFLVSRCSLLDLFSLITKEHENGGRRVASSQLGHQRMRDKAFLGLLFVLFLGSIKDGLQIRRRETRSSGSGLRHVKRGQMSERAMLVR